MHTVEHVRGPGIGHMMLDYLIAVARERGFERRSLETGSMEAFAPACSLYLSAGLRRAAIRRLSPEPKQHLYDDEG
jgi:putative acetyltransferase